MTIKFEQFLITGTRHRTEQKKGQDRILRKRKGRYSVAVLADGAGCYRHSEIGAQFVCETLADLLVTQGDYFFAFDPKVSKEQIMGHLICSLKQKAAEDGQSWLEYSSTIHALLFDHQTHEVLSVNLGNGKLIGIKENQSMILFQDRSDSKKTVLTTTENAIAALDLQIYEPDEFDSLVLLSDGAWKFLESRDGRIKPLTSRQDFSTVRKRILKDPPADDASILFVMMAAH